MSDSDAIENSTDEDCVASNLSDEEVKKNGVEWNAILRHMYCFRHLLVLLVLGMFQQLIVPSVPYIVNSFFATQYGGGDCEVNPASPSCRRGASFAAVVFGWSNAGAHLVAMLLAVCLGSCSDVLGRRPLVRAFGAATLLPVIALALHVTTGMTLWVFLVLQPMVEAFDVNGVYLAIMADSIEDPEERAAAFGTFFALSMLLVVLVLPMGFVLPSSWLLWVSLTAGVVKLIYLFFGFPESAKQRQTDEERPMLTQQHTNPLFTAHSAFSLMTRNAFISRLACVLLFAGLAASGYAIVMPPFMMGYLGFTRKDKLLPMCLAAVSALVSFMCLLGPAVKRLGQVRVLQLCLTASAVVPLLLAVCQEQWQVSLLGLCFVGPLALAVPLVQALKSMLVSPLEQGLVQGALASMTKGAATVGFILFSTVFACTSHEGKVDSTSAVLPSFGLIAGIFAIAAALACTLPLTPPVFSGADEKMVAFVDSGSDC